MTSDSNRIMNEPRYGIVTVKLSESYKKIVTVSMSESGSMRVLLNLSEKKGSPNFGLLFSKLNPRNLPLQ